MPRMLGGGHKPSSILISIYCSRRTWTLEQAVYLAFSVNPEPSPIDAGGRPYRPPPLTNEQVRLLLKAREAVEAGELASEPTPAEFILWADSTGLNFSDAWLTELALSRLDGRIHPLEEANAIRRSRLEAKLIQDWALAPSWTHQEGVALSLNVPPQLADKVEVRRRLDERNVGEYVRRLEFAKRAYDMGQLPYEPAPRRFLDWAAHVGFPFPEAWEAAVPGKRLSSDDNRELPAISPPAPPQAQLGARERDSLLKMIIGMAVEQYGYDPRASRNDATAQIAGDLAELGISLDQDTVRKYLKEAAELLPQDALDED